MFSIKKYINSFFQPSSNQLGPFSNLKVALIADALTQSSLEVECQVKNLTPSNYIKIIREWKPDLLFVESAWQGFRNSWRYRVASYPEHLNRNNELLRCVVQMANGEGIPTVFWNKEDDVHYHRFISSAQLFDYIFTVDGNCVEKYIKDAPSVKRVGTLMFPVQPRFHNEIAESSPITGFSCFVGSYGRHVHERRRTWQDMLFEAFSSGGVDVYDRNSYRKAEHYRYPVVPGLKVLPSVPYRKTAEIYRRYKFNLNVNTIEQSPTMYSRRLIEILAVGGVAISTPSAAVSRLFSDYCTIVDSPDSVRQVLEWSNSEYVAAKERAHQGAMSIAAQHTWRNRLAQLEDVRIF